MSWAAGFERGQRIAKGLVDTYNQAKQQGEIEKIVNEKPVDATGLSTEQNEQVFQSLADGGTARDVQNEDGSFGGVAVSKPMPDDVEGPAQAKTLAPQKITTYLGKEFVGGLDPSKATSARNRALAGVITKSDPIQGMKLDALLTQTDREEQDYGDKQKVRTLQQQFTAERDPLKRAEIGRQLAALPGGGEVVKGFGDIEQANYRAVVNHARGFLAKGDVKGAMGVYNQYDNGEDGEVLELPGGGYQLNFYQGKPGDGNQPTSSKTFKTLDEVSQWYDDQFDPEAAVKRRTESATNTLKFNNEIKKAVAIEQAKSLVREGTLRPGYKWEVNPETGEPTGAQIPTGSGAGARSGGGRGKAEKTPAEQLDDIIKDTISGVNGQSNPLTLDQSAMYRTVAQDAVKLNPGIDPRLASQAALAFAQNPGTVAQVWKPELGAFVEQVQMPQGYVAVNKVTYRNAAARNLKPEQLKQAVESSISSIAGTDATKRQKVIAAAFDNTGVARRALLDEALAGLRQMPQFKALSPQGQAEALKNHELSVNQALAGSLGWITNFGQDLNK